MGGVGFNLRGLYKAGVMSGGCTVDVLNIHGRISDGKFKLNKKNKKKQKTSATIVVG